MDLRTLLDTPPWEWPPAAGRLFLQVLVDQRAKAIDRLIAAELAGDLVVINEDLADALLAIVGNSGEPEELRARAAISLGPVLEHGDMGGFDPPNDMPITEGAFRNIQDLLRKFYHDSSTPKEVRRRILEASVRAPEAWHQDAIAQAYSSGDKKWMLTAVFAMGWVRGFDNQILAALESANPDIHYEAVQAAGYWELDAAWPHVVDLVNDPDTPKRLLLAAIGAVGSIRPAEAAMILIDLADSDDEDIAEAADEALMMAEGATAYEEEDQEEDEKGGWIN
jgi:hypothetical protein